MLKTMKNAPYQLISSMNGERWEGRIQETFTTSANMDLKKYAEKYQNNYFAVTTWYYGNKENYQPYIYLDKNDFADYICRHAEKSFVDHGDGVCLFYIHQDAGGGYVHKHQIWLHLRSQIEDSAGWGCRLGKDSDLILEESCLQVYCQFGDDFVIDPDFELAMSAEFDRETEDLIDENDDLSFSQWFFNFCIEYIDPNFFIEVGEGAINYGVTNKPFDSFLWDRLKSDYRNFVLSEKELY